MSEIQKLDPQSLDVTELEDSELEAAAGGKFAPGDVSNTGCPTTINNVC